ncbi:nicotianamine synthase family protein [Salicibibacter kimchii]|uniref:Nicotianamine synthase n=1 Tax=Salicibibacter kimchii TaxID=2099786 RepID=A0A345C2C4_9BACI|nr:nicotianamine synthase family protein [Salicibibacter kimchii]AXF57355.1 nicotianamine synthase [Salicibibacter kimchii]
MNVSLFKNEQKDEILAFYKYAYHILKREKDLSPANPLINQTLSNLVHKLSTPIEDAHMILDNPYIQEIKDDMIEHLAAAECDMETYFGSYFAENASSLSDLSSFLYWDNYKELTETEVNKLYDLPFSWKELNHICFIGAGALPLSPLLMSTKLHATIDCLDIEKSAYSVGNALIHRLHKDEQLFYKYKDGEAFNYQDTDLVVIASLVPNKELIIEQIRRTNPNTIIALRSAENLHTLLYHPINIAIIEQLGYQLIGNTVANSFIINSTLFFAYQ